ncbi:MAG: hypothetical protein WAN48_11500 [Actinomycetes bacterium]
MANDYDLTARNVMLDALGLVAVRVALHTGDPGGVNGASNEVTGGGYARQAISWFPAAAGAMDNNANPVFSIPASTTVAWVSYWNAAGSIRYLKKDVSDDVFSSAGTYTITDADLDLNDA